MFLFKKKKKLSENNQKLLEVKNMNKYSTESLEEKAEEISQKTYFKERECRGAGNIEKNEKR